MDPADEGEDVDLEELQKSMKIRGIEWIFNPPNAPHFRGALERKIQSLKNVLNGALLLLGPRELTFDEFHTYVSLSVKYCQFDPPLGTF